MTFKGIKSQSGIALTSVMIAIMISTLLAVYATIKVVAELNSATAEATGTYMMNVRGAVLRSLSEHSHVYQQIDISAAPAGTYPDAPSWASFTGPTHDINILDLKQRYSSDPDVPALLPDAFPDTPPMGRSVHVRFIRTGTCPGECNVDAYVYTCWPIRSGRPAGEIDVTTCPAPPAGWEEDSALVGDVIMASEGYGGTNMLEPERIHGTLFNEASADLGLPADTPGIVAVLASLTNSMHNQYVRQGDNRHIFLNNNLTVDGYVQTNTGLVMNTDHAVGSACDFEDMYATSNRRSLVQCKGGYWYEMANHMITNQQEVANNANATAPVCPGPNLEPFYIATLSGHDSRMSGTSNISVQGTISGTTSISGSVNQTGSISGSGPISGSFTSNNSSFVRVTQRATINSAGRVTITGNPQANARALVISGCRTRV